MTASVAQTTRRRTNRRKPVAYLFVAPFFILFTTMVVAPLVYAAVASLYRTQLIGGTQFVGLANYLQAFGDPLFYQGMGRVLLYMLIEIPLTLGLALVFALAFDSGRMRGGAASRLLMFLPNAVPAVVAALMWGYLYGKDFGPVSQLFRALGLQPVDLLSEQNVLGAIINIVFWSVLGYTMIILYSALQTIPPELYEAARIDGASEIRIALSIKMPALLPSLALTGVLAIIGGFQLFNEPNLLMPMAPQSISSAFTPNMYIYRTAFASGNIGYATAMSIILGLIIIIVAVAMQLSSRRKVQR